MGRKTLQISNYKPEEIKELFSKEPKYKTGIRLYAVYQLAQGIPSRKLEELYNTSFKQICTWANNFNALGIEGLQDKPRPGRTPKLSTQQKDELKQIIELLSPADFGFDTSTWNGTIVTELIKDRWNVEYKKAQIYNMLKGLGFAFQRQKGLCTQQDSNSEKHLYSQ